MKYLNIVSSLRKTPDYRKDEKFYKNMLGPKNVQSAIEHCEKLQKDLNRRYKDKQEEAMLRLKLQELDNNDKLEDEANEKRLKEKSVENVSLKPENSSNRINNKEVKPTTTNMITTWELTAMIKQRSTSFIIFDVRSREDYAASHINHQNCLSIPEDLLKPG